MIIIIITFVIITIIIRMRGTIVEMFTCPSQPSPASPQGLQSSSEQPASIVVGHDTTFDHAIFKLSFDQKIVMITPPWTASSSSSLFWWQYEYLQQEAVLGEPLHRSDQDVDESQPIAIPLSLTPGEVRFEHLAKVVVVKKMVNLADVMLILMCMMLMLTATWLSLSCSLQYCWQLVCSAQYL